VVYAVYRGRVLKLPLRETVRAPAMVLSGTLEVEYRSIVVPVVRSTESEEALVTAARLAAERRSRVAIVHVLEIPMELPLTARLPEAEREANSLLDDARALVESYGVRAVTRLERARAAGPAIVADVVARGAELVVLGATRRGIGRRAPLFGTTARYGMKHSPCRVLVAATKPAARPAVAAA
jgi:nucleotide-binding universal stress UspA family protein